MSKQTQPQEPLTLTLALLSSASADITTKTCTHSSKGVAATPTILHKLLLPQLEVGVAMFVYRKQSGELRKAIGTLRKELIPASQFSGVRKDTTADTKVNYYDLDACSFKSFTKDNLVAVVIL